VLDWVPEAIDELKELMDYAYQFSPEAGVAVRDAIIQKAEWLATHSMAGGRVEGLSSEYKVGYTKKSKYRIYYRTLSQDYIEILMVRHASRPKPRIEELQGRERD